MEAKPLNLYILVDALQEVGTQLVMLLFSWIDWLFTEHLLLSNIISAALLLGLADLSIQLIEMFILRTRAEYESVRTCKAQSTSAPTNPACLPFSLFSVAKYI
ncbi:hypothetical protein PoB_003737000 [Plakobranchus ocellatus]|uniref:Uncharacterized protein n=1 Tax=Plakobranchus ocellatus TaxID=259542 RepID=A0AAV4AU73_9GAST|nr:hypothetical protein PoB_003737000 [Plakobranchus ocellatus]